MYRSLETRMMRRIYGTSGIVHINSVFFFRDSYNLVFRIHGSQDKMDTYLSCKLYVVFKSNNRLLVSLYILLCKICEFSLRVISREFLKRACQEVSAEPRICIFLDRINSRFYEFSNTSIFSAPCILGCINFPFYGSSNV